MSNTPRLGLPYILTAQAQKEVTHNESLNLLDILVQTVVESRSLAIPPATPLTGGLWVVAAGASGDWAGQDDMIAYRQPSGWTFHAPFDGLRVWVRDEALPGAFLAAGWQFGALHATSLVVGGQTVVGGREPAIADPSGGVTTDAEARATIANILVAMRNHGLIAT